MSILIHSSYRLLLARIGVVAIASIELINCDPRFTLTPLMKVDRVILYNTLLRYTSRESLGMYSLIVRIYNSSGITLVM